MCQELWHFLPILPSNVKVSIHIAWHIIATQIFKKSTTFPVRIKCLSFTYGDHTWPPGGNPGDEGMKTIPQVNISSSSFSLWGLSLEYRKALWKVRRHGLFWGNNASALQLPCRFFQIHCPSTSLFNIFLLLLDPREKCSSPSEILTGETDPLRYKSA